MLQKQIRADIIAKKLVTDYWVTNEDFLQLVGEKDSRNKFKQKIISIQFLHQTILN